MTIFQPSLSPTPLAAIIRDAIAEAPEQRISLARYMALALYHPEHGYYQQ